MISLEFDTKKTANCRLEDSQLCLIRDDIDKLWTKNLLNPLKPFLPLLKHIPR